MKANEPNQEVIIEEAFSGCKDCSNYPKDGNINVCNCSLVWTITD